MKNTLIKIGAYLILLIGVLITLFFVGFMLYEFIAYPDSSVQKKAMVAVGLLCIGAVVLLITIAVFETMLELNKLESDSIGTRKIKDE